MKRRDFLRFRAGDALQVAELSCQRLYMGYSDARSAPGIPSVRADSVNGEWWSGEPPLETSAKSVEHFFDELDAQIAIADVLVLEERDWLEDREFAQYVDQLLARFRSRGGEVRFSTRNSIKASPEAPVYAQRQGPL